MGLLRYGAVKNRTLGKLSASGGGSLLEANHLEAVAATGTDTQT